MAHYGCIGKGRVSEDVRDVRGVTVRGADNERLGKVNDVIFDHDSMEIRYVVVDSVGWLEAGKFLLPLDRLISDGKHSDGLASDTTREQIKHAPQYKEQPQGSNGEWKRYEQEFKKYWEDQPVMHIKGSDRIITPPEEPAPAQLSSSQTSSSSGSGRQVNAASLFPERMTRVFPDPTPGSGKVILRPRESARVEEAAAGVNQLRPRWWEAFENYLHRNKRNIQAKCSECSTNAA
jgi:hypothetical protein